MTSSQHVYEVRPRKDKRGVDLISDVLPFGRLWYGGPNAVANAIGCAKQFSWSHDAVIRVYDDAGNVIETHEAQGRFQRVVICSSNFLPVFSAHMVQLPYRSQSQLKLQNALDLCLT
jgi:hypothetical protein